MANSTISGHVSRLTFGARSVVSSRSTSSDSSADSKQVTVLQTSVSRNISSGNAVQINGPVAGKIYNLNFKNLVVNCQCSLTSRIASHSKEKARPTVSKKPLIQNEPTESIVEIPDSDSGIPAPPGQNLGLYSKTSGNRRIVRAIFRPGIPDNFIARRIVDRLELTSTSNPMVIKTVLWGKNPMSSTTDFVDLACTTEEGTDSVAYRFYVVKHCPFDLLFGSSLINPEVDHHTRFLPS